MTIELQLTHDAGVDAFTDAGGAVDTDDGISFCWDEEHVVHVDAPADLRGAFDTERFYKIEGATVARPIKQPYLMGDDIETYKKPAAELDTAAWSFDNVPFTLGHPETGMVRDVDDIHGFWRNPRYDHDEDRLNADLYIPTSDDEALEWVEDHDSVSVGFYNRTVSEYDGNTGDLTDDDVDGFQVDIYGNHIAGVERGRCSTEHGCGLDGQQHGEVVDAPARAAAREERPGESASDFTEGDRVLWMADAIVAHNPEDERGVMVEIVGMDGERTGMVTTVPETAVEHRSPLRRSDGTGDAACGCDDTVESTDAPEGIYMEDDKWYGVAPSETSDDEPKYELDNCNDVKDAWNLRGSGDYDIDQSTLESRIKRAADSHDCPPEQRPWEDKNTDSNMSNDNDDFDIPDLSVDALAEQNDAVAELRDERDEYQEALDDRRERLDEAFDSAEQFTVELDEDECRCDAVADLVADLDEKAAEVEDLRDELQEYRQEEVEDRLDELADLGADREEWEEKDLDAIEDEIERRKEVLDEVDSATVKDLDGTTDGGADENTDGDSTLGGTRTFGRGYSA